MRNRVLFTAIVLLGASTAAHALEMGNCGARVDSSTGSSADAPPPIQIFPTFVEFHSARVENDLMLFAPTRVGIAPAGRSRVPELLGTAPAQHEMHFFVAAEAADALDLRRDRDRLLLFRGPQPQGASVALGLAMFTATTVLSAHLPRPLRILFDGPVHLGPAIFDGGGMGAGIAGRGL
jgi:hypothetical protein